MSANAAVNYAESFIASVKSRCQENAKIILRIPGAALRSKSHDAIDELKK